MCAKVQPVSCVGEGKSQCAARCGQERASQANRAEPPMAPGTLPRRRRLAGRGHGAVLTGWAGLVVKVKRGFEKAAKCRRLLIDIAAVKSSHLLQ